MRVKLRPGRVVTRITMAVATLFLAARCAGADTPVSIAKVADGVLLKTPHDQVHITVCGSSMIHVTAAPDAPKASSPQQPWIVGPCAAGAFSLTQTEKFYLLGTDALQVKISVAAGGLQFADKAGNTLLTEGIWSWTSTRQYQPVEQAGSPLYNLSQSFQMPEDEAIYGLGQHQTGSLNNRGLAISLAQNNTDVAVPLMILTRGYGLMWNTAARSMMNNQFPRSVRFSAEGVEGLDYYFLYGPEADQIIHHSFSIRIRATPTPTSTESMQRFPCGGRRVQAR